MKKEKNIIVMLKIVTLIILTSGCANNSSFLSERKVPELLSIKQKNNKDVRNKKEYVFCDIKKGAWKCPGVTKKTSLNEKNENDKDVEKDISNQLDQSEKIDRKKERKPLLRVNFEFNSFLLDAKYKNQINKLIRDFEGKNILLIGFTDNIGKEKYNDELALKRAESVKKFLITKGVKSSSIVTEGHGLCCYLVINDNDKNKRINRRVEVYISD